MKCLPMMLRSVSGLSCQFRAPWMIRTFSMKSNSGGDGNERKSSGFFESADDFEQRIFSGVSENIPNTDSFYQKLDRLEKARGRFGTGSRGNDGNNYQFMDGLDESFNSLSDGMDGKLKKAATYFAHSDEMNNDDYAFRPDISFRSGMSYTTKDLDLTKPGIRKSFKRSEFDVTTEEVLRKADFRTRISAKAQRKVAREIKTARAFGLMPFTTMGTKAFVFGNTMEDFIMDYKFDGYNASPMAVEAEEKKAVEAEEKGPI
ncbi:uncharacterized protein LOC131255651 isoform X3 [Magnolia sinica]|uniref:uncharacterized protein LOC131255651 isoform X3 n=1 Tax=Magnolia sinica TaxID=86752 RepID=UPI002658744A|nr:uncharacterized protein LOC131255651 isoform X3 [Magnolia sinica]